MVLVSSTSIHVSLLLSNKLSVAPYESDGDYFTARSIILWINRKLSHSDWSNSTFSGRLSLFDKYIDFDHRYLSEYLISRGIARYIRILLDL